MIITVLNKVRITAVGGRSNSLFALGSWLWGQERVPLCVVVMAIARITVQSILLPVDGCFNSIIKLDRLVISVLFLKVNYQLVINLRLCVIIKCRGRCYSCI
jgi:hypothetical protein